MKMKRVELILCEACLTGVGGICNVPGCALCRNSAPDLPIPPEAYVVKQEWEYDEDTKPEAKP